MSANDLKSDMTCLEDPWSSPLETLDPSVGLIFKNGWQHAYFKRLRQQDPVHWSPTGPSGGYWSITRFQDIIEIEKNHQIFSSQDSIAIGDAQEDFMVPMFIAMDPPEHDVQRKAAMPAVAGPQLAVLEDLIRQRTKAVLQSLPVGESFNWVEKVSINLTTQFLATLFDFPWEDRHLLTYWSDVSTASDLVGNHSMSEDDRRAVLLECLAYFQKLWMERAAAPPTFDFVSLLAHNPETRDMIDRPMEFLGNLMLLIVGGNDTTRNSMTGGVYFLNQFPQEYTKLKADTGLIPNMVSEIIRYQTPLAHMRRTALVDTEFRGKRIKQGDRVIMWYVSGNRDETEIELADQFIIDRAQARHHLSFGFGIHRCMGNRAAEMQIRILWEEIMKLFAHIEVLEEPERVESNFVMGYEKLMVRIQSL